MASRHIEDIIEEEFLPAPWAKAQEVSPLYPISTFRSFTVAVARTGLMRRRWARTNTAGCGTRLSSSQADINPHGFIVAWYPSEVHQRRYRRSVSHANATLSMDAAGCGPGAPHQLGQIERAKN
eukprot:scaffold30615_cov64-Phaeocystis_antarctica.AAC.6